MDDIIKTAYEAVIVQISNSLTNSYLTTKITIHHGFYYTIDPNTSKRFTMKKVILTVILVSLLKPTIDVDSTKSTVIVITNS